LEDDDFSRNLPPVPSSKLVTDKDEGEDGDLDDDNNGDGFLKPFSNPSKEKKQEKFNPIMKADSVYSANKS
jgi:hypothetical protein